MASSNDSQNVWFGVAMFLIGLLVGAVLAIAATNGFVLIGSKNAPTAPVGNMPQAPVRTAQEIMSEIVNDLGIDENAFKACASSDAYTAKINEQMAAGQKAGINGTPGSILVDMKTKKAKLVSGALPYEQFKQQIDDLIAGKAADDKVVFDAVDFSKDHVRGDQSARIAIIEYSDFQCPYCHKVHPTLQKLVDDYKGQVAWVYRHYPLNFHPDAMPYAVGSECVRELAGIDAFWKFTDAVMEQ